MRYYFVYCAFAMTGGFFFAKSPAGAFLEMQPVLLAASFVILGAQCIFLKRMPDKPSWQSEIFFIGTSILLFFILGSLAFHQHMQRIDTHLFERLAAYEQELSIRSVRADIQKISQKRAGRPLVRAKVKEVLVCGPGGCKRIAAGHEADILLKDYSGPLQTGPVILQGSIGIRDPILAGLYLEICDASILEETGSGLDAFRKRFNAFLSHFYYANMDSRSAGIAKAIVLADAKNIPPSLYKRFTASGTAHLLSVSGLHVSLLIYMGAALFKKIFIFLGLKKTWVIPLLLFLLAYNFLVLPKASILRATLMFCLFALTGLFGRNASKEVFLPYCYILIAVFVPSYLQHIGFYLSFLAMGAIVYVVPLLQKPLVKAGLADNYFIGIALVSTAIHIVLIPLLAHTFGYFSTVFILSNIVCIPIFTGCAVGLFSSSMIALFFPQAGAFLLRATAVLIDIFVDTVSFFADFPYASIETDLFGSKIVLWAYYGLLAAWIILARKKRSR